MKNDIATSEDIILLINEFYKKVRADKTIGFIFNGAVTINWSEHLPIMYSFWETMLLGKASYRSNAMQKHLDLNKIIPLKEAHFNSWISIWEETVSEFFSGPKAEEAILKAKSIKDIMQFKVQQNNSN